MGLPTLADIARDMDPRSNVARIVDLLSAQYEITSDLIWSYGNLPTGRRWRRRTGAEWRAYLSGRLHRRAIERQLARRYVLKRPAYGVS